MTKSILGTFAAAAIVVLPLAAAGAASDNTQDDQLAQSASSRIIEKCAMLKDPNERAACIREGFGASNSGTRESE